MRPTIRRIVSTNSKHYIFSTQLLSLIIQKHIVLITKCYTWTFSHTINAFISFQTMYLYYYVVLDLDTGFSA